MLMAIVVLGLLCKSKFRKTPFLMDRVGNITNCEHVIDIRSSTEVSSSGSSLGAGRLDSSQHDHQSSTNLRNLVSQPTSSLANGSNSRNSSLIIRRGDGSGRHRSSPLNSGLWISVELVFTACQIVAAVVVLSLSKDEHPHAPLFGWILGYAFGCAATLPLLYWRWYYCNQASESGSSQQRQESTWSSSSTALSALTNMRNSEGDGQTIDPTLRGSQIVRVPNPRLKEIVEYLKMALDCLFAVWFVVGNVWIFGWHSSFSEAPKLYSLCIVFLAISCIGYAMPFILFATICCCLPCIIAVLGFREDFNQARGATSESINSLPTYKFKTKKTSNREHNSAAGDDGVVAAGTEKEQAISAEDAVCCICLAKYANNDELRELPCSHFFHKECVDSRCGTHLFASEVAIHKALLNSDVRTFEPREADFFYVPVYVSCNFSSVNGFPAIGHTRALLSSAIDRISSELPFWNRSHGSDHVFVASHDFGPCFHNMEDVAIADGIPEFLRNSVILQTFGVDYPHPCQAAENVVIPPYVSIDAVRAALAKLPANGNRDIFAFFRGKMEIHPKNISGRFYSKRVRTAIWRRYGNDRRFYLKRYRYAGYQSEIARSVFCLCPLGWAPWSPRLVESVVLGCVPVIIADNIRLPFPSAVDWSAISLTVAENDIGKLGWVLDHVAATNLTIIQRNLGDPAVSRALLFSDNMEEGDATWQVLSALSQKLERSHRVTRVVTSW